MSAKTDAFVANYLKWLTDSITERQLETGWTEISTPFLDCYNDGIAVYAREEDGRILLSDDGAVASATICLGGMPAQGKQEAFRDFLRPYGVEVLPDWELQMPATPETYPIRFHLFLQAIMAANDIFSQGVKDEGSRGFFTEDIAKFFDTSDVAYSKNVKLEGQSGIIHEVGFILPKKGSRPERLVYAINKPNRQSVELALFNWSDIQRKRGGNSGMIAFLNDADKTPPKSILQAFRSYDAVPIAWSRREEHKNDLAV